MGVQYKAGVGKTSRMDAEDREDVLSGKITAKPLAELAKLPCRVAGSEIGEPEFVLKTVNFRDYQHSEEA